METRCASQPWRCWSRSWMAVAWCFVETGAKSDGPAPHRWISLAPRSWKASQYDDRSGTASFATSSKALKRNCGGVSPLLLSRAASFTSETPVGVARRTDLREHRGGLVWQVHLRGEYDGPFEGGRRQGLDALASSEHPTRPAIEEERNVRTDVGGEGQEILPRQLRAPEPVEGQQGCIAASELPPPSPAATGISFRNPIAAPSSTRPRCHAAGGPL